MDCQNVLNVLKIVCVVLLIAVYVFIAYKIYDKYGAKENDGEDVGNEDINIKEYIVDVDIDELEPVINMNKITEVESAVNTKTESENKIEYPKYVSLGEFKLTSYCSCGVCCGKWANNRPIDEYGNEIVYGATGERLKENYSIAVDPNVIPYGTEVIINGRIYKAQDCGGAIKGNRIDVYFNDHKTALDFGVQYAEVFIVEN